MSYRIAWDCRREVSLSLMALTNALCVCVQGRAHYHYTCIAVDRGASQRAGVCVCLYVIHDAIIVFVVTVVV